MQDNTIIDTATKCSHPSQPMHLCSTNVVTMSKYFLQTFLANAFDFNKELSFHFSRWRVQTLKKSEKHRIDNFDAFRFFRTGYFGKTWKNQMLLCKNVESIFGFLEKLRNSRFFGFTRTRKHAIYMKIWFKSISN